MLWGDTEMTLFNDTYKIKSVIGKGGMSNVYLAKHKSLHTHWAVKEMRKQGGIDNETYVIYLTGADITFMLLRTA